MKILVTAGPTREKIDPVRFISNRSSGKMGYALAEAARELGHEVVLVSGPVALTPPENVEVVKVESAAEMAAAVKSAAPNCGMVIMAAAVADYRPAHAAEHKLKKNPGEMFLELERTEDILLSLGNMKHSGQILVGFAAETEELINNAAGKLERKNLDWIVANTVADGFGTDTDKVTMLGRNGQRIDVPRAAKRDVARRILDVLTPKEK